MSGSEAYEPYRVGGWRGVVLGDWAAGLGSDDPLEVYLRHPHRCVRERPGGKTWCVSVDGELVYVKHVSAEHCTDEEGGWRTGKRLRWAVRRSPAMRLVKITQEMLARGVHAPRVLHAARKGMGLRREELIVTEGVRGRRVMRLTEKEPATASLLRDRLADHIRHMHDAGIVHGHLLPGHILLTEDRERIVFIDNDENVIFDGPAPWRERMGNLVQLANQVSPMYHAWRSFFTRYFEGSGLPRRRWRLMLADVLRRARRRDRAGGRNRVSRARALRRRLAERDTTDTPLPMDTRS